MSDVQDDLRSERADLVALVERVLADNPDNPDEVTLAILGTLVQAVRKYRYSEFDAAIQQEEQKLARSAVGAQLLSLDFSSLSPEECQQAARCLYRKIKGRFGAEATRLLFAKMGKPAPKKFTAQLKNKELLDVYDALAPLGITRVSRLVATANRGAAKEKVPHKERFSRGSADEEAVAKQITRLLERRKRGAV